MVAIASPRPDQAALAYALTIGTILEELGFRDADTARAFAAFWLCDPADDAVAAAARALTARLVATELPLATIVQVHGRLVALEIRHLAAGQGTDLGAVCDWIEAAHARLVLLLACVEGERVCGGGLEPAVPTDQAVAALAEAASILNRSLDGLRAAAAPRQAA